jgi:hypothetical protein
MEGQVMTYTKEDRNTAIVVSTLVERAGGLRLQDREDEAEALLDAARDMVGSLVGREVTVVPRVMFSADRDTEPGAQPWQATFLGLAEDGDGYMVKEDGAAKPRNLRLTELAVVGDGKHAHLQLGSWSATS